MCNRRGEGGKTVRVYVLVSESSLMAADEAREREQTGQEMDQPGVEVKPQLARFLAASPAHHAL